MASTTQANPSGKPTLKITRIKIRSLELGGSMAPTTSSSATTAASKLNRNSEAGNWAGDLRHRAISQNAFANRSIATSFSHNHGSKLYTRITGMPDAIWVDKNE